MGYYTEYFSTLLKGIRMTALKERIEVRRVINNLKKADHTLYKSLFEDVEKEHKVNRAIQEEERLIQELKKSSENAYSLIFNLSTEEIQLLKVVENILKELEAFSKSVSDPQLIKVERELALTVFQALKKAEEEERDEFKQVMTVINEAEEKDKNKFMANIRLAFQKEDQQTMLAKFAARAEVRKAKYDILKLQQIPVKIKALRRRATEKGKKEGVERVIGELYGTIQEIKKYANEAFKEMFLLQKRTTLIALKILLDLNNLRDFNKRWVGINYMPQEPIAKKNAEIDKVEDEISNHFHTGAQAFRIIITKIQNLEKEAEVDASIR